METRLDGKHVVRNYNRESCVHKHICSIRALINPHSFPPTPWIPIECFPAVDVIKHLCWWHRRAALQNSLGHGWITTLYRKYIYTGLYSQALCILQYKLSRLLSSADTVIVLHSRTIQEARFHFSSSCKNNRCFLSCRSFIFMGIAAPCFDQNEFLSICQNSRKWCLKVVMDPVSFPDVFSVTFRSDRHLWSPLVCVNINLH